MPKPKPTQVIRHEIVFGRSERALLEPALYSYTARNASRAWFNLTSDLTTVVVSLILYEYFTGKSTGLLELVGDTTGTVYGWLIDAWNAYRTSPEYAEKYDERAASVAGGFQNMWDNFIDVFSGATLDRMNENRANS